LDDDAVERLVLLPVRVDRMRGRRHAYWLSQEQPTHTGPVIRIRRPADDPYGVAPGATCHPAPTYANAARSIDRRVTTNRPAGRGSPETSPATYPSYRRITWPSNSDSTLLVRSLGQPRQSYSAQVAL
jgi:hypothetical protein